MNKRKNRSQGTLGLKTHIHRIQVVFGKNAAHLWKQAKPFLAPRYWLIYVLAFSLGFFLWGPAGGWQRIRNWQARQSLPQEKPPTTETLQHQLEQLKQELKSVQSGKKEPPFNPATLSRPGLGQVVQGFDWMQSGNSWRLHSGVDIGVPPGSNVLASAAGTISAIDEIPGGGSEVTINHGDGWETVYSNLAKLLVTEGQQVIKGVIIGISGPSGCDPLKPSFHFAVFHNRQPVDPAKIISGLANKTQVD